MIASPIDWYGFPIPNVTDPSDPTSGVCQAPPDPSPSAATPGASSPTTVLNFHSSFPLAASSAISTPPPGPDPYALAR